MYLYSLDIYVYRNARVARAALTWVARAAALTWAARAITCVLLIFAYYYSYYRYLVSPVSRCALGHKRHIISLVSLCSVNTVIWWDLICHQIPCL